MSDNSVPPCMSLVPQHWNSEWVRLIKSLCGHFEKNTWYSSSPLSVSLSQNPSWFLQSEVLRTSCPCIGTLGRGVWCVAGTPHSTGRTSAYKTSFPIFICHSWVWDKPVLHLCPSYQSQLWLLYVLSCGTSIHLDFRWFWIMVVVLFSSNFYVVVGGFEYCICLLYHLDQLSHKLLKLELF